MYVRLSTRNHQYWKKRNIPYVKPIPLFGCLLETFRKSLHIIEVERYKKYGAVYGHYEGTYPVISIADPTLLKKIFVKDFHAFTCRRTFETGEPVMDKNVSIVKGEDWKRIRSIITPTFTSGRLKRMMSIFKECSQVCVNNFMKYAESGEPINLKTYFEAFTMDVIASAAFSTKIDSINDPKNKFVGAARDLFKNVRNDFLQLLLDTAKEVQDQESQETSDDLTAISNIEVVAQCVTFFVAGFDATASTLSFAFYLLALNKDVQEKLIAEIDEVLKSEGGKLNYEAIQSMKYLDNVISETLRLYPPAVRIERVADEDYDLGYKGIKIPKGMLVSIPVFAIHNDPKYYPDPEKFDPDRFSPEERAKRDQLIFMPFGFGPRNCIGMRFVLMQIKVCLAFLLSNFRFKRCAQTRVPMEFLAAQFLLQPKDIMIKLEIRKDGLKSS
ncbi:cytochrome P450 3A21-like [Uloborus diversus]|uniref:cytochrome P450 3A21-like n=1 Tax=Uloborus diversus TaxID=327109 RepID=UPI00240A2B98|nr:cytochrome P450 3A21-like [Uloborus diversus]